MARQQSYLGDVLKFVLWCLVVWGIMAVVAPDAALPASVMFGALLFGIVAYAVSDRRTRDGGRTTLD